MEQHGQVVGCNYSSCHEEDQMELRRGPWTVEEDFTLINYIAHHGEGRWNSLARCAGLKRTGKSCRLRWLNYLRPDVRRGNITLEEQLLILELHSRWGNRWSKIAQHLPGRTDNEIKNYWRTRVQKHAKQLKCDVNSKQFKDTMRYLWMPRLVERIQANAGGGGPATATVANNNYALLPDNNNYQFANGGENSSAAASSDSFVSDITDHCYNNYPPPSNQQQAVSQQEYYPMNNSNQFPYDGLTSPTGYFPPAGHVDFIDQSSNWMDGADVVSDNLWNVDDEDMWFLHNQFNTNINV